MVQVGKGNPWVEFAPEGKDYLVEGFWLDPADGKEGPYYRLARQNHWLLLPKTASAQMSYMKFDDIPVCVDMPEACFLADRDHKTVQDMMQECDNHERCNGFTYTTNKTKHGGGCLKYRCESEDTDGVTRHTAAEASGKVEYYGRLAFQWTIEPPSKCDQGCGFSGSFNKGQRHCSRITDAAIMDDEVCEFWTPKMPKPEIPEVVCPATAPCVDYVTTTPQDCPSTCGYSGGDLQGTVTCTETVTGKTVDAQACDDWAIAKPKIPSITCAPTFMCAPDCPKGSEQSGTVENADIPGCGMDACGDRYSQPTIEACQKACDKRKGCNAFTWAPVDGDKNHKGVRVCTMYTDTTPTSTWGPAQVFCKLTWKTPAESCGIWEQCAREHGKCKFTGTKKVRYGHGNKWTQGHYTTEVMCTNSVFGDPFHGQVKTCETYEEYPSCGGTWERCASEGESCEITTTSLVKYGHGEAWSFKTFEGPTKNVPCNNNNFGDPFVGQRKGCFVYVEKPEDPAEHSECSDAAGISEYSDVGTGKCVTEDGTDPEYSYYHSVGEAQCKAQCDKDSTCYGYSSNSYNNCLIWRSCNLKGGGAYWGAADCNIKKIPVGSAAVAVIDMVEKLPEDELNGLGLSSKSQDAVMQKILALPQDVTAKKAAKADSEAAEEVMVEEMEPKNTDDAEFQKWMDA